MAPAALTPASSGTSTPTTRTASALTEAGIKHMTGNTTTPSLAPLDASRLRVSLTQKPRAVPEIDSAEERAQKTCTDHMVTALWTAEKGWEDPELKPYGPLEIVSSSLIAGAFHGSSVRRRWSWMLVESSYALFMTGMWLTFDPLI